MRTPRPDTGLLSAPKPDRGLLLAPRPDIGSFRFPPRPVFAVLVNAHGFGAGVASAAIAYVPWRDAAGAGNGAFTAQVSTSTSIGLAAAGSGAGTPVVVKTVIDAPAFGEGAATLAVSVSTSTLQPAVGSGAASLPNTRDSILTAVGAGAGAHSATVSASTSIAVAASGASASTQAVKPSPNVAATGAGSGAAGLAVFTGYTYSDDFNRASLDSAWTVIGSNAPVLNSNAAQAGTSGALNATTLYPARYASAVAFDNHRANVTLVAPVGSANYALGGGPFVRCDSSGNRVELVITSNSVAITTRIGGTGTTRATASSLSLPAGTVVELAAVGNVYTAYVNGSSVTSWTDSGNVITIGSTTRSVGFTAASNKTFAGAMTYGWAFNDWLGRDG